MKRIIPMITIFLLALFAVPSGATTVTSVTSFDVNQTFSEMSKVTKAQIEEWKAEHGMVYMLESDGKVAYIYDPTTNIKVMKMITAAAQKGGVTVMAESVINNCWLGGDEDIRDKEQYRMGLLDQIDEMIEIPEYDIDFDSTPGHAIVKVLGKECKLRLANRGDIKYAESRNKQNKPFDTSIYLLERIGVEGVNEIEKDGRAYLGLLMAVGEVKDKKYVAIKKL